MTSIVKQIDLPERIGFKSNACPEILCLGESLQKQKEFLTPDSSLSEEECSSPLSTRVSKLRTPHPHLISAIPFADSTIEGNREPKMIVTLPASYTARKMSTLADFMFLVGTGKTEASPTTPTPLRKLSKQAPQGARAHLRSN